VTRSAAVYLSVCPYGRTCGAHKEVFTQHSAWSRLWLE